MPSIQPRGKAFQLRIKHKLLNKPFFATFDTRPEAENYSDQMMAMLSQGVVPQELLTEKKAPDDSLLMVVVRDFTKHYPALTNSDDELLDAIVQDKPLQGIRLSGLTYSFVESYVRWLKSADKNMAPGSIRKRIGALGRVLDWQIKRTTPDHEVPRANVFRMLPKGYSAYTKADAARAPAKVDVQRNRRLAPDEVARIEATLAGVKREDKERVFTDDPAFPLLYHLLVDTGLRLYEGYRLTVPMIDLEVNVIHVDGSKGHRGQVKPRVVPIKKHLRKPLKDWLKGRVGLVFPYWNGHQETRQRTSNNLSARFSSLFAYAQVEDFTEHDLRHEAACRWFTLRNPRGGWMYSEIEVCRMMGWSDTRMALRYASLRGEDLSARLG